MRPQVTKMSSFLGKIERFFEELFVGIFKKGQAGFIFWFVVIFLGTLAMLAGLGLLPSELKEESSGNNFVEEGQRLLNETLNSETQAEIQKQNEARIKAAAQAQIDAKNQAAKPGQNGTQTAAQNNGGISYGLLPQRLVIPSINMDAKIYSPTSTSTKDLDHELTKGPVRYPGSGTVGFGNMFIFGHSTGWSVVQNKAYKVFNQIKTLHKGDVIYVDAAPDSSGVKTYEYRVREVTEVNKNDTQINFDTTNNMLTLSTCDSFGARSDRFVVTADFVGIKSQASAVSVE